MSRWLETKEEYATSLPGTGFVLMEYFAGIDMLLAGRKYDFSSHNQ